MSLTEDHVRLKAVNHVTYNVVDKEKATKFWVDVLGVKQIPKQVDAEHIIWLQLPSGAMIHIVETPEGPSTPSHHGAFEVEDIDAAAKVVQQKGIETTDITTRNDGQRVFFLNDPEGNRIEICTKSGFGVLV
ncbi:MAG: VOC family protein [SAR202 cluster bacterium]|nr:VOC family protein [SAR202 cluster bacterium]|tara:strand:- start:1405 stop:1800 length:396 start_codon:yes stop_codon:yes gene_type:complete